MRDAGERWPLTGRGPLLDRLCATAEEPGRTGIVLVGDAGVGKTRLAGEVVARLSGRGHPAEWVTASRAMATIPFGAVSQLLPPGTEPPGDARVDVLRRIAAGFSAHVRGAARLPVLGVDDAHLLDHASAAVVHHLATRGLAFLVVTVRAREPYPDAVSALWSGGLAVRAELGRLPACAVDALLDHTFGAMLAPTARRRLHRTSAGNPLLLREILGAGLDSGALRQRDGMWHWSGPVATTRLTEVVAARLGALDDAVRDALEVVATGEPIPVALLEQMVDAGALAAAERRRLVVGETSGLRQEARLAHPLYGEVLRSTMAPSRARTIARRLAKALSATPMRRRDDALRVGVWQLRAGVPGDPAVLLRAARQAQNRFDHTLAVRLAMAARAAGGGWQASQLLAEILSHQGRYAELARELEDPPESAGAAERLRWATVRADSLYWGEGKIAEAERLLDETEDQLADVAPDGGNGLLDGERCWLLLFDARCAEAVRVGERVLRSPTSEPQAVIWAASAAVPAAGLLGEAGRAGPIHRRGVTVATDHAADLPWGEAQMGYARCIALLAAGELDEAWDLTDRAYRSTAGRDFAVPLGGWAGFRGSVAKARGDLVTAGASLREALLLLAGYDAFRLAAPCLAELAGVRALAGDHRQATRLLARADAPERQASRLFVPWIERNRAWVLAAAGDVVAGAAQARHAAELARAGELPTVEGWALYDAARLGEAASVRARLRELAGSFGLGPALATAADALADRDPALLGAATEVFARHGHRLLAAETAAETVRVLGATGRRGELAATAERAAELLARCPGVRTPLLSARPAEPALTRRERDVARLAAAGRSSKEIAERLALSVRTVDNYLGHVYDKLGVTGRGELARLFTPVR